MSYIIRNYDKCFYCNNTIRWEKTIIEPGVSGVYSIEGQEANVVLTGKEEDRISYEATVRCHRCGTVNKFVGSTKL